MEYEEIFWWFIYVTFGVGVFLTAAGIIFN